MPRGTQAVSPKSVPHSCSRAAVRLAPSESVPRGTRAVSAPRAVGCALVALGRLPTEPSRATSVPASGPRVPSRASLSVPGAATRPPATRHPPPRHNVRPVPIPTQARASAHGASSTGQHVGLGAERRSGGDQRLHSPTAWLPPGHEPGAGGVAQLPSSKKVWPLGPEDFWIDDATPWSRRSIGVTARRQARMITARTVRSRHARLGHGAHASVTARTARSRRARIGHSAHASVPAHTPRSRRARSGHGAHASVTVHTLRSRRARIGHGTHASVTTRTHWSRRARLDRCARGAARQALWARRARRPRRRDYYSARSGAGSEAAAGGGS